MDGGRTNRKGGFAALPLLAATLAVVLGGGEAASATRPSSPPATRASGWAATERPETFASPQKAADALIEAAENFDVAGLSRIFGAEGIDIVLSGDLAHDRERATLFAAQARKANRVALDPKTRKLAFLVVGDQHWPFPVPIVEHGQRWFFDAPLGRQEILNRRIGGNELDAIAISRGYVEAQYAYAFRPRTGYDVNEYARRIISTPGTQDGLAWRNADGTWGGPIGPNVARAIQLSYDVSRNAFHGYLFKVLTGQGPDAPLGAMDYLVHGLMIGGFALVAAPAEYGQTGVMTFIVNQDGIVYQKDLGPSTMNEFRSMEVFNPDRSWKPVPGSQP